MNGSSCARTVHTLRNFHGLRVPNFLSNLTGKCTFRRGGGLSLSSRHLLTRNHCITPMRENSLLTARMQSGANSAHTNTPYYDMLLSVSSALVFYKQERQNMSTPIHLVRLNCMVQNRAHRPDSCLYSSLYTMRGCASRLFFNKLPSSLHPQKARADKTHKAIRMGGVDRAL